VFDGHKVVVIIPHKLAQDAEYTQLRICLTCASFTVPVILAGAYFFRACKKTG
jgi:hypothetical protein